MQCDQIGLLLKSFGYIFFNKIRPEIGQLFVIFLQKTALASFWASNVKIGPLLIFSGGVDAKC